MSHCAICGGLINPRFFICPACATAYGILETPFRLWPRWMKTLCVYERRERRYNARWRGKFVTLEWLG